MSTARKLPSPGPESATMRVGRSSPPSLSVVPPPHEEALPRVLVVDDDERNRELMKAYLHGCPYEVTVAESGHEALARAQRTELDLVLVDAMMPVMDGLELVRRLKQIDPLLPVVVVTALGEEARLTALDAGAEEFLSKPVDRHELRARVRNLVRLRAGQRALAAKNAELVRLQSFKDEMVALLVHDLKSPLSAMTMNLAVALKNVPAERAEARDAIEDARRGGTRLFRMIANLLDIAKSDEGRLVPRKAPVDLGALAENLTLAHQQEAGVRGIELRVRARSVVASADADLLGRVLENLLENALRYTRRDGRIAVSVTEEGDHVRICVANDGAPIPDDVRKRIFDKYGQAAPSNRLNRGLGLYFSRVAAEAHGGTIRVGVEPGYPTAFEVLVPRG